MPKSNHEEENNSALPSTKEPTRRDFLSLTAVAMGTVGAGAVAIPFINSMNPSKDVMALATIDIDLKEIPVGQTKVTLWRGRPVFIRHRTDDEIKQAKDVTLKNLPDPQTDQERFKNPQWLVVVGVCTHLGCVPSERKGLSEKNAGGWLCACHGSIYDVSGRIVQGPAPKNLEVPPYEFINNNTVLRIGTV